MRKKSKYKIGDKVRFFAYVLLYEEEGEIIRIYPKSRDYDHDPDSTKIYVVRTVEGKQYYVAKDDMLNKVCYIYKLKDEFIEGGQGWGIL